MKYKQTKMIAAVILCVGMIAAVAFLFTGVKSSPDNILVYSLSETKSIKMKNIGECITINCEVFPDNATNKTILWEVSNEEYLQVVKKGDTYITLKKLMNFPSFVLVRASAVEDDFTDFCKIYSYNEIDCIVSAEIVDQSNHQVVSQLHPNHLYSLNLIYKASSDNLRDLDDEMAEENYINDLKEILLTQYNWLYDSLKGWQDFENDEEYRYLFFEFKTNEGIDWFKRALHQKITVPFGDFSATFEFDLYIKITQLKLNDSVLTI